MLGEVIIANLANLTTMATTAPIIASEITVTTTFTAATLISLEE